MEQTDFIYTLETGSKIDFFSADQPSKVRGPRRDRPFLNEANNVPYEAFDQLEVRTKDFLFLDWHFEPMQKQINVWREHELPDIEAKSVICDAFIGRGIDAPQHLGKEVHRHYFAPVIEDFQPRTFWSLSNAFTSAFKELEPVPQIKAAPSLGPFLKQYES